jgi:YggT family protein
MNVGLTLARLLDFYGILLVVYVVLGWVAMGSRSGAVYDIYRALAKICEPYLSIFRRILPPVMMGSAGIDLSPFIGLIVLQAISRLLAGF